MAQATTESVRVRPLAETDGFALRVGSDTLVYVSIELEPGRRLAASRHLLRAVHDVPDRIVTANVSCEQARALPSAVPRQRIGER